MAELLKTAAGISNQWSLAAFAIAAVLYVVLKRRGKVPSIAWAGLFAIVLMGLVPILASVYVEKTRLTDHTSAIYRVRVTILDPQQMPVDDAKVWSSLGGEAKKVAGGWQLDIPAASQPADGKLTVYAAAPNAFLTGRRELQLTADRNPAVVVQLAKETSATVRGIVIDASGKAISGARVSVVGFESEAVLTQTGGNFMLPAHAAHGQQTQLHAEKTGHAAANQFHPAGEEPVTLVLDRK